LIVYFVRDVAILRYTPVYAFSITSRGEAPAETRSRVAERRDREGASENERVAANDPSAFVLEDNNEERRDNADPMV